MRDWITTAARLDWPKDRLETIADVTNGMNGVVILVTTATIAIRTGGGSLMRFFKDLTPECFRTANADTADIEMWVKPK